MSVKQILQLGNSKLYQVSEPVQSHEWDILKPLIMDLHDTMMDFRQRFGKGRAIAAPQIGVFKRVIYMHTGSPRVFINPVLRFPEPEIMEVWDDCMSFPSLLVKVERFRKVGVNYLEEDRKWHNALFQDDLAELIQHEYDHLDGILAVSRAIDGHSFSLIEEFGNVGEMNQ